VYDIVIVNKITIKIVLYIILLKKFVFLKTFLPHTSYINA